MKKNLKSFRKKVEEFEKVRKSGVTNMFNRKVVCELAGLTKEEYLDIMKNYDNYIIELKIDRN